VPSTRPPSVGNEESIGRFALEAAHGLAELEPDDLAPGNLTLPLGLSVWMRRGRVGLEDARHALFALRRALLAASGLDERTEPVPLVVADPVAATINLAFYLDDLLRRAAAAAEVSRSELAGRAAALLVA